MPKVAVEEVGRRGAGDGGVVGLDVGDVGEQTGGADVDRGNAQPAAERRDSPGRGRVLDPRDHAVAVPFRQRRKRRRRPAMLRKEHRPGLVLADMPVDAREQAPRIGV